MFITLAPGLEHPEVALPEGRIHLDHLVRDDRPDEGDEETDKLGLGREGLIAGVNVINSLSNLVGRTIRTYFLKNRKNKYVAECYFASDYYILEVYSTSDTLLG